jgi:hypothetical protein
MYEGVVLQKKSIGNYFPLSGILLELCLKQSGILLSPLL